MGKKLRFTVSVLANLYILNGLCQSGSLCAYILLGVAAALALWPEERKNTYPTKRLYRLAAGAARLRVFLTVMTIQVLWMLWWIPYALRNLRPEPVSTAAMVGIVLFDGIWLALLFWSGMLPVYLTSVQLGIRHRVLAALCGWVPGLNIWYLTKIIRITGEEAEFEREKWELDEVRAENEICRTQYPILLVHGVFFRDFRYLNYWGRIPRALMRNGATVYYGRQQSAAAVEDSGKELAGRIRQILAETGCEKVNIIAHSKGGLDSRAAIAHQGMAPYVASLTTINTPHRGCIFAEYIFNRCPESFRQKLAAAYNATLKRLGDPNPDFLAAVKDLTESACLARNGETPDAEGVLYESVMSYCKKAGSGKFPLNVTYPVVKHFDGQNDGLVAVDSARWGSAFTLLEPQGGRGISHGDMVDLNRENISGFDVREFYVNLVSRLKQRGY